MKMNQFIKEIYVMNKNKLSIMLILLNLVPIFAIELYTNIDTAMD
jgi:hypothetical protein